MDVLRVSFEVACAADHAFATWTERIGTWWPKDHTVSGSPEAVVFETGVGGRIYESTSRGEEHQWGTITRWSPPQLLAYRWHLGVREETATDVIVRFVPLAGEMTRIEIEQSGWDVLGLAAVELKERNRSGWESLVPPFRAAAE